MSDYDNDYDEYSGDDDFEAPSQEEDDDFLVSTPKHSQKLNAVHVQQPIFAPPRRNGPVHLNLTDAQRAHAVKALKHSLAKMKLVQLTEVKADNLLVLAATSEYQLLEMGRGIYASKRAGVTQTREDNMDEEVQTEEPSTRSVLSQAPDDRSLDLTATAGDTLISRTVQRLIRLDPQEEAKLGDFMKWAGPMVMAALGSAPSQGKHIALSATNPSGLGLSAGRLRLKYDELLHGRPVSAVSFCGGGEPLVLVAYQPVGAQLGAAELVTDHTLAAKGVLCVWSLSSPESPQHVMLTEGNPLCCAWGTPPHKHLVFAGMEEGGVCAWDLNEPDQQHPLERINSTTQMRMRRPSYSTEALASTQNAAAVVSMVSVPRDDEDSNWRVPCQLITLSTWGEVSMYTVTALAPNDPAADTDAGVRIGSRVRLLHHFANIQVGPRMAASKPQAKEGDLPTQLLHATCIASLPQHTRQFVIGADGGRALRGCLIGIPPAPKTYLPADVKASEGITLKQLPSTVTSLSVSPFLPRAFLAAHDNGTIALHVTHLSLPVALFPEITRGRIIRVHWSPARPSVFFVFDSLCTVHVFDLLQNRFAPVHSEAYLTHDMGVGSFSTMVETGLVDSTEGLKPVYVVAYDDGNVDCHAFTSRFAYVADKSDLNCLKEMLGLVGVQ